MREFIFLRDVKTEVLTVNVRHDLSVDELVQLNNFDWKTGFVTSWNFPAKKGPAKKQKLILVSMRKRVRSTEVVRVTKALKCRPARPVHLLSLGLDYPNQQRESSLMALGQTWRDADRVRHVPGLYFVLGRGLGLVRYGCGWGFGCRFLAVRSAD